MQSKKIIFVIDWWKKFVKFEEINIKIYQDYIICIHISQNTYFLEQKKKKNNVKNERFGFHEFWDPYKGSQRTLKTRFQPVSNKNITIFIMLYSLETFKWRQSSSYVLIILIKYIIKNISFNK